MGATGSSVRAPARHRSNALTGLAEVEFDPPVEPVRPLLPNLVAATRADRPLLAGTPGIVVDVEERGVPTGQGYQFSVLGAHDADIRMLTSLALARAEDEIGRLHLEPSGSGWTLVGDEVTGRFVWDTSSPRVTPTPW